MNSFLGFLIKYQSNETKWRKTTTVFKVNVSSSKINLVAQNLYFYIHVTICPKYDNYDISLTKPFQPIIKYINLKGLFMFTNTRATSTKHVNSIVHSL